MNANHITKNVTRTTDPKHRCFINPAITEVFLFWEAVSKNKTRERKSMVKTHLFVLYGDAEKLYSLFLGLWLQLFNQDTFHCTGNDHSQYQTSAITSGLRSFSSFILCTDYVLPPHKFLAVH
jgi:hypothetical protein